MREIIYALLYLTCAAVLTAFPAFLLFLLFREPPAVSGSEHTRALVSRSVETKTPALAATHAHEDPQPTREPAWIAPTPKYEYDRPSNARTGAHALEAFAADTEQEDASRAPKEREVITPQSHSAYGRGSGEFYREIDGPAVFDTPPLTPD